MFVKVPECSLVASGEQRHLVGLMVSIYPGVYARKAMGTVFVKVPDCSHVDCVWPLR